MQGKFNCFWNKFKSPEVWKDKPYNEKSDIWSMGCVFYEMTTLKPPFHAKDMEGLYNKVIRGNIKNYNFILILNRFLF